MTREAPLNILQLYHDCGPGGAEQMILDFSCWLRTRGHRVTLATCTEGWLAHQSRQHGMDTHVIPKRHWFDPQVIREIVRLAQELRVGLLHAHEFPMIIGIAPAARLKGIPLVATVHGREVIAARRRRRLALRLAGRWCRRVVAVSQAVRRFLVREVRIPTMNVETIYNGINIRRYEGGVGQERLREALGIAPRARVIGTVGSLYPVKGQVYLLRAMAQVARQVPETVCLIAGRGQLLPALEREARDLHLSDRVKFLGYRSDIPDLLSLMDIFVLPSMSEGLPLSLLEAQAAGKPVVASHVGGNPEAVEDGKTGYLVPPGEPDILADRIRHLLNHPAAAAAMGERGRERVQQMFSLEAMAQRYLSLFTNCINGGVADHAASVR